MLDLVAVREGQTAGEAIAVAVKTAQHAEQLGFERYWLAELKREVGRLIVQTTSAVTGKILTPEDQTRLAEETVKPFAV